MSREEIFPPTDKVYIHKAAVDRNLTLSLRESSFSESSGRQTCSSRPARVWICMTFAWGVPAAASYGLQTHRWPRPRLSLLSLMCSRSAAVQMARVYSRTHGGSSDATQRPVNQSLHYWFIMCVFSIYVHDLHCFMLTSVLSLILVLFLWFHWMYLFMRDILIFVSHDNLHV